MQLRLIQGNTAIRSKIKAYVKENWGSPFILAFMVLLLSAAVFLSAGLSNQADVVAVYAYYALVAGVVLQLVCFLKPKKTCATEVNQ
jgi:heme/copper-type cytochrome/quinol oxidase subunit 4